MADKTPEQEAAERLMGAFIACVSGRATMRDWQLIHTALFGAPFQLVVGAPPQEKDNGPDKSTGS